MGQACVRGWKQVVMDAEELVGGIEKPGAEIPRALKGHVAPVAIELCLLRVIKAARAVAGDAA